MTDPNNYQGSGSRGTQVALVNVVAAHAVDNTGVTDAGAGFAVALPLEVASGQASWCPRGTYALKTNFVTPSHCTLELSPDALIDQQFPQSGVPFKNSFLYASSTARGTANGALAVTPTLYQAEQTISVTIGTEPIVGDYLFLSATGASKGGGAVYKIVAITNPGGALAGTVALTLNSSAVTFSNAQTLTKGGTLIFSSQPGVYYPVSASTVASTAAVLTVNYTGPIAAAATVTYLASLTGTAAPTFGSAVVPTTLSQVGLINPGDPVLFASQLGVYYTVLSVAAGAITLTASYTGTTAAATTFSDLSGAASPYMITLDRAMVWPFQAGDIVTELTAIPEKITVIGNNAVVSGTGDEVYEIAYAKDIRISGLKYNASLGSLGLSGVGSSPGIGALDIGTINSIAEDCQADLTLSSPGLGGGFQLQSNERGLLRRMAVTGVQAPGGNAYTIFDSFLSGIEDSWVYGGVSTASGFLVDTLNVNFPGSTDCWIRGGGAIGCGIGMLIQGGSSGLIVGDWSAIGCALNGISVSTSSKTRLEGITCNYCLGAGIATGTTATDVSIKDADCSHAGGGATHGSIGALDIQSGGLTTIDGLTIDLASPAGGEANIGINTHAGLSTIVARGVRITCVSGDGIFATANRFELTDATITMTASTGGAICYSTGGGISVLRNVVGVSGGSGGFGVFVSATSTVTIGLGCDFSGCTTPVSVAAGGVLTVEQAGELAFVMAGGTQTSAWTQAASLILSGTSGTIRLPAIAGMQWTVVNNGSGAATVQPTGGTAIVVAAGKTAVLRINDSLNMARVTPDAPAAGPFMFGAFASLSTAVAQSIPAGSGALTSSTDLVLGCIAPHADSFSNLTIQHTGNVANVGGQQITYQLNQNGAAVAAGVIVGVATTAGVKTGRVVFTPVALAAGDVLTVTLTPTAPLTAALVDVMASVS